MKVGDLIESKNNMNARFGPHMISEILHGQHRSKRTLIRVLALPDLSTNGQWYDAALWKVMS